MPDNSDKGVKETQLLKWIRNRLSRYKSKEL